MMTFVALTALFRTGFGVFRRCPGGLSYYPRIFRRLLRLLVVAMGVCGLGFFCCMDMRYLTIPMYLSFLSFCRTTEGVPLFHFPMLDGRAEERRCQRSFI
jgi:hypothetical protein